MSLQSACSGGEVLGRVEVGEGILVGEVRPAAEFVHDLLKRRMVAPPGELGEVCSEVRPPERAERVTSNGSRGNDWSPADGGRQPKAKIGRQEGRVAGDGEAMGATFLGGPCQGAGDPGQRAWGRLGDVDDVRQAERRGELRRPVDRKPHAAGAKSVEAPGDQRTTAERLARLVTSEPARPTPGKDDAGDDHGAEIGG